MTRRRANSLPNIRRRNSLDDGPEVRQPLQRNASFGRERSNSIPDGEGRDLGSMSPDDLGRLSTNELSRFRGRDLSRLTSDRFNRLKERAPTPTLWQSYFSSESAPRQENILAELQARAGGREILPAEIALRGRVHGFLQGKREVKVAFEEGINFGNLAAGLSLIQSLKELGFEREITIVASQGAYDKLRQLDPEAVASFRLEPREEFDALAEYGLPEAEGDDVLHVMANGDMIDSETSLNLLNYLRTDSALVMSPYGWQRSSEASARRMLRRKEEEPGFEVAARLDLETDREALYKYNVTPPDDFDAFLLKEMPGPENLERRRAITELKRRVDAGELEFMPAYGLHRLGDEQLMNTEAYLIEGIKQAFPGKPVALFSLSQSRVDYAPLHETAGLVRGTLGDEDLTAKVTALPSDASGVLMIDARGIPNAVFTEIYRMATLPSVLEGANTSNLVQVLGKPFISARTNDTKFPYNAKDENAAAIGELHTVRDVLTTKTNLNEMAEDSEDFATLGQLESATGILNRVKGYVEADFPDELVGDLPQLSNNLEKLGLPPIEIDPRFNLTMRQRFSMAPDALEALNRDLLTYTRTLGLDGIEAALDDIRRQTKQAITAEIAGRISGGEQIALEPAGIDAVAALLRNSREEGAVVNNYFNRVSASVNTPERDQVLQILGEVTQL